MRFLYSDNGVLTDITRKIENYKSGSHTFSYVTGQDYIYIGSALPFNHFYIKMGGTVNAVTTTMAIEYWSGKSWESVVEIIDETEGLTTSGFVTFTPDKSEKWTAESTNDSGNIITELSTIKIYDMFWMRVSFGNTLTPSTIVSWIGNLFANDYDLYSEYPVFNSSNLLSVFESGKTSWEEQHVKAAQVIIKDMIAKNVIYGAENILKKEDFNLAAVSKCAQLIFTALGDDYVDDALASKAEYKERLDNGQYSVDLNDDAILDKTEKFNKVGFMRR